MECFKGPEDDVRAAGPGFPGKREIGRCYKSQVAAPSLVGHSTLRRVPWSTRSAVCDRSYCAGSGDPPVGGMSDMAFNLPTTDRWNLVSTR